MNHASDIRNKSDYNIVTSGPWTTLMTSETIVITRMHSSRMRTVRCSGRLIGGGMSVGGVYTSPSPWTEFLTHTCENITFPELRLRMVITLWWHLCELHYSIVKSSQCMTLTTHEMLIMTKRRTNQNTLSPAHNEQFDCTGSVVIICSKSPGARWNRTRCKRALL